MFAKVQREENKTKVLPLYQDINGLTICGKFDRDLAIEALNYKPRDDDLFIVTYPKCGTTWAQQIVTLILNKGKPIEDPMEFGARNPFIEMQGTEWVFNMPRPGAIKTHLPFNLAPYNPKAKYIYIVRNPKDTVVSFYHHTAGIPGYDFSDGSFDDFFELFMAGEVDYNDYFDHVLSWWAHRDEGNVLFLTYEDMKADLKKAIKGMAAFIGKEYAEAIEAGPEVLENIVKFSDFAHMKQANGKATEKMMEQMATIDLEDPKVPKFLKVVKRITTTSTPNPRPHEHFRKGVVNDWKNQLSKDQSERLNELFLERTKGTGVDKLWDTEHWL